MSELGDFDLGPSEEPLEGETQPVRPRGPSPGKILLGAAVVVAALAGLGYFGLRHWGTAKPPAATPIPPPSLTAAAVPTPLPSPINLPSLDESDGLVRDLAKDLSRDPQFSSWLTTPDLLRTLTAVVENVVTNENPRPHLGFLAPKQPFAVIQREGRTFIDPESYRRFDGLAEAVASIDAAGSARVYGQLEPLFALAYRELGHPQGGFAKSLRNAVDLLAHTPIPEGDVQVRPVLRPVLVYELSDPRLEALSPAQKALLRMGPANARKVQAKLAELADALSPAPGN